MPPFTFSSTLSGSDAYSSYCKWSDEGLKSFWNTLKEFRDSLGWLYTNLILLTFLLACVSLLKLDVFRSRFEVRVVSMVCLLLFSVFLLSKKLFYLSLFSFFESFSLLMCFLMRCCRQTSTFLEDLFFYMQWLYILDIFYLRDWISEVNLDYCFYCLAILFPRS